MPWTHIANNDDIDPGTGTDAVMAGPGDDTIRLAAGDVPASSFEVLDGGVGVDTVVSTGIPAGNVTATGPESYEILDPLTGGLYLSSGIEVVQ